MVRVVVGVLLLAFGFFSGCADTSKQPLAEAAQESLVIPDPNIAGDLQTLSFLYDFGVMLVDDSEVPGYTYPVQLTGSIHAPSEGAGPFPVLLFMHGRHGTCAILGLEIIFTHVCPSAVVIEPVNSFQGYDYLAENLASHGYIVASVNANQINDRDFLGDAGANARGELTLRTLDELATIHANGHLTSVDLDGLQGRIDMTRIGLMGHSRGGEGVVRANDLNHARAAPHAIKAVFALAPTDFARWPVQDVAFATILPYCDGDVYNLQGAWMYDDARRLANIGPLHQVVAIGANHNFYNTVWTGDDWGTNGDPWCGSAADKTGRDSADDQRRHGLAVMGSFFRLYVGNETDFMPYWTGAEPFPASACPGGVGPCPGRLLVSRFDAQIQGLVSIDGIGSAVDGAVFEGCMPPNCPGRPTISLTPQTVYSWSENASVRFDVEAGAVDFKSPPSDDICAFAFRVGIPVGGEAVAMAVRLTTSDGRNATISLAGHPALAAPPGDDAAKTLLNMVRVPFANGIPASELATVELLLYGAGQIQVADVALVA